MFKNKFLPAILAVFMTFGLFSSGESFALEKKNLKLWVNGDYIFSSQEPFIENSRTFVPVRFVSESLGCKVTYDSNSKEIVVGKGGNYAVLTLNSKKLKVNDKISTMDVAPVLRDSRTFVPIRLIEKITDTKVDFDSKTRTVTVGNGFKVGDFYGAKFYSKAVKPFVSSFKIDFSNLNIKKSDGSVVKYKSENEIIDLIKGSVNDVYKDDYKEKLKVSSAEDFVFDSSSRTITKYLGSAKDVIIPSVINSVPVENIADGVFKAKGLETVYLPSGLKTIGEDSFSYNSLSHIIIPDGVKSVSKLAFYSNDIVSVTLPDGLVSIEDSAFGKNLIYEINLPSSLKEIGSYAFTENNIKRLILPDSVEKIENSAFFGNSINFLSLPKSIKKIEERVFSKNKLAGVSLPDSVTEVGKEAFSENLIDHIDFSNTLERIGDGAFRDNKLEYITFPSSLRFIGQKSFADNRLRKVKMNEKIDTIEQYAFFGNDDLKDLTVPMHCELVGTVVSDGVEVYTDLR